MIQIPLNYGKTVVIDEIDIPLINHYTWYAWRSAPTQSSERECWYAVANVTLPTGKRSTVYLHRLIAHPASNQLVDHLDYNGLNNTRSNLRACSKSQNNAHQRPNVNSKSAFKGVQWAEREQRWAARIKSNRKTRHIGYYSDPVDAAKAYDNAARQLFGEFAYLNFPDGG